MPISEDAYRTPKFFKHSDRYPLSDNKKDKFTGTVVNPKVTQGRANSEDGSGWRQPGYNPSHNSTTPERINLTTENLTLKKY